MLIYQSPVKSIRKCVGLNGFEIMFRILDYDVCNDRAQGRSCQCEYYA